MSGLDTVSNEPGFIPLNANLEAPISDDVAAVNQEQGNFAENLAATLTALAEAQEGMECGNRKAEEAKRKAEEEKARRKKERTDGQKTSLETEKKISGQAKGTPTRAPRGR